MFAECHGHVMRAKANWRSFLRPNDVNVAEKQRSLGESWVEQKGERANGGREGLMSVMY